MGPRECFTISSDRAIPVLSGREKEVTEPEDGEDMEEEEEGDGNEEEEEVSEADPRAGGVDVTLPQLKVDYQGLAELLFTVGSSNGVKKSNREILYKLGKGFKDVVQG